MINGAFITEPMDLKQPVNSQMRLHVYVITFVCPTAVHVCDERTCRRTSNWVFLQAMISDLQQTVQRSYEICVAERRDVCFATVSTYLITIQFLEICKGSNNCAVYQVPMYLLTNLLTMFECSDSRRICLILIILFFYFATACWSVFDSYTEEWSDFHRATTKPAPAIDTFYTRQHFFVFFYNYCWWRVTSIADFAVYFQSGETGRKTI